VLDSSLRRVPPGFAGELFIAGAGVAQGYLRRQALTEERFIALPQLGYGDAKFYRTGDRVRYLSEGHLHYLGRNDRQIKIRGYRIELDEIENVLRGCAGITAAAVKVVEFGQPVGKRVVAYICRDGASQSDLNEQLQQRLPHYMVPSNFVELAQLPLTDNGKINYRALPRPDLHEQPEEAAALETPTQIRLAEIMGELLRQPVHSRRSNFFELGGHSLLATQLASRIEQHFGLEMPLRAVFEHARLDELADEIDRRLEGSVGRPDGMMAPSLMENPLHPGVIALRTGGEALPLFLVHEALGEVLSWGTQLTRHLDEDIPVYGLAAEPPAKLTLRTMQGMAARLVQAIRTIQPKGPYRIAGWSFGGTLAYEIATQLIGNDDEVQFLGLLDAMYGTVEIGRFSQDSEILRELVLQQNPSSTVLENLNSIDSTDLDILWEKCKELSLAPENLISLTAKDLRLYFSRIRMHIEALNMYEGSSIHIPIYLFAAQDNSAVEPLYGWSKILPAERLLLIPVPGDHYSMLQEPSVATLGAELSRCIRGKFKAASPDARPRDPVLIPIQTAPRPKGSLFCIPGAGGSVASFTWLTDGLGDGWQIYGLQPRGLNGIDVPHSTVSAAATYYLRELEKNNPAEMGSIHLLGHSFGGWVAFEMALQMQASGRSPASLTLIDSEVPHDAHSCGREYTRVGVLMKLVEIWELTAECSLNMNSEALEALKPADQLSLLHEHAVRAGLMPRQTKPDVLTGTIRTLGAALRTHYCPATTYNAAVNLILLADPKLDSQAQEHEFEQLAAGWRCWAPQLEVWRGPGNHMTALKRPDVGILAGWLRAKLPVIPAR